eukprot:1113313-Rhodomonas_salina.2
MAVWYQDGLPQAFMVAPRPLWSLRTCYGKSGTDIGVRCYALRTLVPIPAVVACIWVSWSRYRASDRLISPRDVTA